LPRPASGRSATSAREERIRFTDVTPSRRYKQELEHANQGLEDAHAELQSTNEELETMDEEMQATNEELHTINDGLGQRTTELNQLNASLESIWAGLDGAVTVLDADLRGAGRVLVVDESDREPPTLTG
jgi:chromosome segregation ATPase